MSKLFKRLTAAALAGVMAIGMAAPAYAGTTACDHFGKVYTQELEPHYTYDYHDSGTKFGQCVQTNKYRTFVTACITCGVLGTGSHTEKTHSIPGCKYDT